MIAITYRDAQAQNVEWLDWWSTFLGFLLRTRSVRGMEYYNVANSLKCIQSVIEERK
jgi:hypothetical protein